jgi:hypothetical protein
LPEVPPLQAAACRQGEARGMKYADLEPMCRIDRRGLRSGQAMRGCPHDGLGCIGGARCSINSPDARVAGRAYNATHYGPDFFCYKRACAAAEKVSA